MCHLDGLRAAKLPLSLPAPYDKMFMKIKSKEKSDLSIYMILIVTQHYYYYPLNLLIIMK